jgi:glycosyltransferase involved in cell wall biosynthesis
MFFFGKKKAFLAPHPSPTQGAPAMPPLHPLHRAWRALPAAQRRAALTRLTALAAPRPDWPPPRARHGLVVGGELGRASGLGEGARLMASACAQLGVPAWTLDCGLLPPGEPRAAQTEAPPPGAPLVLHVNAPILPAALLRLPRGLLRGRRVIGYWAWELSVVPDIWRHGARFVHDVWVPSRFTAAALEPLAPGRVRVVPHPVAASPPRPSALNRADFGLPEDAVITLVSFSLASSFARKNPHAAIAAHRAAFGDRPDRMLLLKIAHAEHAPDDMDALRALCAGSDNIGFETRLLPVADSHALTGCADIVLSLHRSEGFGLVPAEAMLLGRPVIATDYSGTTDFIDADCAIPIAYRLVPAVDPRGVFEAPGAVWAEADVADAAGALARLADDAAERARLGKAGQRAARARLGAGALAAAIGALGIVPEAAATPPAANPPAANP